MTHPTVEPDPLADDPELTEYRDRQLAEYGTYVATSRIYAGNALAYEVGHPVPVSNVVKHGYLLNNQVALVEGQDHPAEVLAIIEPKQSPAAVEPDAEADDNEDGAQ